MSKSSKQERDNQFDTGLAASLCYKHLLFDFRRYQGSDFLAGAEHELFGDVRKFRSTLPKEIGIVSPYRYKCYAQAENLLKKFRFSTDAYTDEELSEMTFSKFIDLQASLGRSLPLTSFGKLILSRARKIASRILGDCPDDEVIKNVQFGRKSSIGCPLSNAYIDVKLSNTEAFTGTASTTKYFQGHVLPGDHILQKILENHDMEALKGQLSYSHLNLVEVPKTWKVYRLITPLTLIGLFYSYGVGRVVTARLKESGLDISRLQERHRKLVKKFSLSLTHATADLSSASDTITSELLNRILPRPWYRAVSKTFVRTLRFNDCDYHTCSVLPMGNGATFPVETLVFYSIIKAIGELSKVEGIYSVYGDDLIYPSKIHKYVTAAFPQFHFKLNLDKTFVSFPFRESCGSDFYRGQDVRSFYLKGQAELLYKNRYTAWLYKLYNGLTERWDPEEIRGTLSWILAELAFVARKIYRVPPSFPESSGIRVSQLASVPLSYHLLPWAPILMHFRHGSRWFQFDFLTETPKKRIVSSVYPYYWLALQGITDEIVDEYGRGEARSRIPDRTFATREAPGSSLSWRALCVRKYTFHKAGKKMVKKRTTWCAEVSARGRGNIAVSTAGVIDVISRKITGKSVSTSTIKTDTISDWI